MDGETAGDAALFWVGIDAWAATRLASLSATRHPPPAHTTMSAPRGGPLTGTRGPPAAPPARKLTIKPLKGERRKRRGCASGGDVVSVCVELCAGCGAATEARAEGAEPQNNDPIDPLNLSRADAARRL